MALIRLLGPTIPLSLALMLGFPLPARSQDPPPLPQPAGADILTRGPVHEAFAQPTSPQPTQGTLATKLPPAAVDEVPPEQKPAGDNVQWISGYWAWDDEANDYIWISGCWRVPPPGMHWMPGHWQEVTGGWLWVSGFWTPNASTQVQYLPPPPPTLEQGPSAPAPEANNVYIPGCWVYVNTGYRWRPGNWIAFNPDWVWVPACYYWTPTGCIFVEGYWDHPLDERGLLFSPVRFDLRLWAGVGRPYMPQFVVQSDFLLGALFVRLTNRHFYFGDYYEANYDARGFVPWFDYHPTPKSYDPCFAFYRHVHAGDPRWEPALRQLYTARRSGELPRPPRTLQKQIELTRALATNRTENIAIRKDLNLTHLQNVNVVAPIDRLKTVRVTNLAGLGGERVVAGREQKVLEVGKEERERELRAAAQVRESAQVRRDTELKMLHEGGVPVVHTDPPKAARIEIPRRPEPEAGRPVINTVPPRIEPPAHEERPIPKYEPVRPPEPRRPK